MVVDDVALLVGERAAADGEIVELAAIELCGGVSTRMPQDSPSRSSRVARGDDVVVAVGQQLLLDRQGGAAVRSLRARSS